MLWLKEQTYVGLSAAQAIARMEGCARKIDASTLKMAGAAVQILNLLLLKWQSNLILQLQLLLQM